MMLNLLQKTSSQQRMSNLCRIAALTLSVFVAGSPAVLAKGKIAIWYSDRNAACQRLLADLRSDDVFRRSLLEQYDVYWNHVEPSAVLPVFQVCKGGRCWKKTGYVSKADLARWLGVQFTAVHNPPPTDNSAVRTERGAETGKRKSDDRDRIAALVAQLAHLRETQQKLAKNQQLLKDLIDALPLKEWIARSQQITQHGSRLQELQRRLQELQETIRQHPFDSRKGSGKSEEPASAASPRAPPGLSNTSSGSSWLEVLTGLAQMLGFGSVVAAGGWAGAAIAGVGLARWLIRRRRKRRQESVNPPAVTDPTIFEKPVPVAVDSPPPPQKVVTQTNFVPYEKDTYAQAVAWAQEQIGRKYPGAIGTLTTLNSLVEQYLKARKVETPQPKEPD